ncbi:hypothetical protein J437_LFUL012022 [Ladona fulva]|uniref:Uncharacterized protein n=1 Tax=Ladona fulva TaxID=123851 RepID=A0A8K0KAU1_LADFU|nr:hypothetical protein J437_LFUL012022 [Ladona fulva]
MSTDNENERLRNEMEKKEKQQKNSPQPSSAAVPISSASVLASIKTVPSQTSHSSQLRQTSSPLVSQQQSTPSAGPAPVSSPQVSSSHSPGCCIPGSTASVVPSGNSDSPSKNKEISNQQLNPSPVTSVTSSPRKADERDTHVRLGPNGESSSDREDVVQMIELDTDADQKDSDEKIPLRVIHGWEPPLLGQLPDDFLRISVPSSSTHWTPNSKKPQALMLSQQLLQQRYAENQERRGALLGAGGAGGDPDLDRFLEDERIALFLQNEEFMAELRWNKDFLSTLEKGFKQVKFKMEEVCFGCYLCSHSQGKITQERVLLA